MREHCAKSMTVRKFRGGAEAVAAFFVCAHFALVASRADARPFTTKIDDLRPSLKLPGKVAEMEVAPSIEQIERRVQASESDARVEPLYLAVPVDDDERAAMALRLAKPKKYRALMAALDVELAKVAGNADPAPGAPAGSWGARGPSGPSEQGAQNNQVNPVAVDDPAKTRKIRVHPDLFRLMSAPAVITKMQRTHLRVAIDSPALLEKPDVRGELLTQLAPFVMSAELRKVAEKLRLALPLDVDTDILPSGPRRAVRTFEIFRGPNCFMTALAFQYPKMVRSQLVNIKAERDHHEVMINNDELWRVLQSSFYEVDPERTPLKFGDMIVFFQLPSNLKSPTDADVSYRWVKHATTYLFNDFVYSKGSKSPNSPYLVGTLRSEWKAWEKHVTTGGGNLGVKVFRKPLKSATSRPPRSLDDWMY